MAKEAVTRRVMAQQTKGKRHYSVMRLPLPNTIPWHVDP